MDNHTIEAKEKEIVQTYGKYIKSTKTYDNGVLMVKFDRDKNNKVMWLKRQITEHYGLKVNQSTIGGKYNSIVYWFELD
jgi:hypothetical protein